MKESRQIQTVVITLDTGENLVFSGRVQVHKNDRRRITDVAFSEPRDLPEGYEWEPAA